MGNLNINLLQIESNQSTNEFLNTLHSFFLLSAFLKPTRIGPTFAILIDNIFTNIPLNKCSPRIIINDILDRPPLYINIKIHEIIKKSGVPKTT